MEKLSFTEALKNDPHPQHRLAGELFELADRYRLENPGDELVGRAATSIVGAVAATLIHHTLEPFKELYFLLSNFLEHGPGKDMKHIKVVSSEEFDAQVGKSPNQAGNNFERQLEGLMMALGRKRNTELN